MRNNVELIVLLLLDVFVSSLTIAFISFWSWFYYEEAFRPPDLDGIPRTIAQLRGDISYISIWCAGFAFIAAFISYLYSFILIESLEFDARRTKSLAIGAAVVHWLILFLPTLWFGYNFWILHTTYKPPL